MYIFNIVELQVKTSAWYQNKRFSMSSWMKNKIIGRARWHPVPDVVTGNYNSASFSSTCRCKYISFTYTIIIHSSEWVTAVIKGKVSGYWLRRFMISLPVLPMGLKSCYLKRGPQIRSIGFTWELISNVGSQIPPKTYWIKFAF